MLQKTRDAVSESCESLITLIVMHSDDVVTYYCVTYY